MKSLLKDLTKPLHQEVYDERDTLLVDKEKQTKTIENLYQTSEKQEMLLEVGQEEIQKLRDKLNSSTITPIDKWLSSRYTQIENIAYKQKRQVTIKQDKKKTEISGSYSVYLNEMITPDAFEVLKYKEQFKRTKGLYKFYEAVAKKFTDDNIWVDEADLYKSSDVYLLPSEVFTFAIKKVDCEDCANALVSLNAEYAANIYGFLTVNGKRFGHSYPMFIDEQDRAFIVETTGNNGEILQFDDSNYEHHIIITKNCTYRVREGVNFGYLDSL